MLSVPCCFVRGIDWTALFQVVVSPVAAVVAGTSGERLVAAWIHVLVDVGIGWFFLRATPGRLRAYALPEQSEETLLGLRQNRRFLLRARRNPGSLGQFSNPVIWRDYYILFGGDESSRLAMIRWMAVIGSLLGLGAFMATDRFEGWMVWMVSMLTAWIPPLFVVSMGVLTIGSISRFGMAFHPREFRDGCMELLLLSRLPARAIVWGKIRAVLLSIKPWTIPNLVLGFATLILAGFQHLSDSTAVLAMLPLISFSAWVACSGTALWLSMRLGRGAALGVCLLIFAVWLFLGRPLIVNNLQDSMILQASASGFYTLLDIALPLLLGSIGIVRVFATFERRVLAVRGGA
jgi:hypothetical protein